MSLPDATITITDGALGTIQSNGRQTATVGTCSGGDTGKVYAFTDLDTITPALGVGPLPEAIAHKLAVAGGTVLAVKATPSTAGAAAATVHVGTGTSAMTLTGTIHDRFKVLVTITTGAADALGGLVRFTYSIDDGRTTSPIVALPASGAFPLPNTGGLGLSFTIVAGHSLVAGDTYEVVCTQPLVNAAALITAMATLTADTRLWKHVHVAGGTAAPSDARTLANQMQTTLGAAETAYRFTHGIIESPGSDDAAQVTAFSTFVSRRVSVAGGEPQVRSPLTGLVFKRSAAWPFAARRHAAPIHEDAGRVATGALPLIEVLDRDESITPVLDAARFVTLRTFPGLRGAYITRGNIMTEDGSDFRLVQMREVMDVACTVQRAAALRYVNENLRTNPAASLPPLVPGAIDERDARNIEADIGGKLRAALVASQHCTDAYIVVNRTVNLQSTQTVFDKVRVIPFGYTAHIESELGFENPLIAGA